MKTIDLVGNTTDERNQWLRSLLTEHVCSVTFTKVNGEVRTMPCTLNSLFIPSVTVDADKPKKEKKVNTDNISVWCTDKQEWRSFKVMNVTQVSVVVPESKIDPVTFDPNIKQVGPNAWSVSLQEDAESGDMIMPLPDTLMQSQGWNVGDTLVWDMKENGSVILTKKE